jgi:outer membrane biosynthesis protein TonB
MDNILEYMAIGFAAKHILEQRTSTGAKVAGLGAAGALGAGTAYGLTRKPKPKEEKPAEATPPTTQTKPDDTTTPAKPTDVTKPVEPVVKPTVPVAKPTTPASPDTVPERVKFAGQLKGLGEGPIGGLGKSIAAAQKGYQQKLAVHRKEMGARLGKPSEAPRVEAVPKLGQNIAGALKKHDVEKGRILPKITKLAKKAGEADPFAALAGAH